LSIGSERQVAVRSLRKNQHAVRADVKRAAEGEAITLARFGDQVAAPMAFKIFTVTLPIAVETELPGPSVRETDDVTLLRFVEEVGNHHDVVAWAALVPTVVGDELAFVAQVKNLGGLAAEAAREVVAIEPQPDQVAVQPNDAVELVALVPVNRDRVAEIISLEDSWPWKSMGMPGAVNTMAAASVERF
jgi:hypothetical protein